MSVAVAIAKFGVAGQDIVLGAGKVAIIGAVVSLTFMVIVAVSQLDEFAFSQIL